MDNFQLLSTYNNSIKELAYDKQTHYLAVGGYNNFIDIWDLQQEKIIKTFSRVGFTCDGYFCENSGYLISSHLDKAINIWDVVNDKKIHSFYIEEIVFALSHWENSSFIGCSWNELAIWNFAEKKREKEIALKNDCMEKIICNGKERIVIIGDCKGGVTVLDTDGKVAGKFTDHLDWLTGVFYIPENDTIISVSWDKKMIAYDRQNLRQKKILNVSSPIITADVSPSKQHCILGLLDGNIIIVNIDSFEVIVTFDNKRSITKVSYINDNYFITGDLDFCLKKWVY